MGQRRGVAPSWWRELAWATRMLVYKRMARVEPEASAYYWRCMTNEILPLGRGL